MHCAIKDQRDRDTLVSDDFNLFSPKDRQDLSYGACIGGTTLTGAAVGRFGMLPGLLAGAAVGLALGLLTCKRLSPAIEKKIFSTNERLTEAELASALRVMRDQTGVRDKSDAMFLFSQLRVAVANGTDLRKGQNACVAPRIAASQLLSSRA